ncbi:MAG: transcriptional regulator [Candidatus Eremiobacteraeota bacterium]|nr:transcriptional regulator [Candidatus Eremiobacteraeota bacterium]
MVVTCSELEERRLREVPTLTSPAGGNRIGEYLRARRQLVRPADVGLHSIGRRRVPGLRREELAMLAGISSDYYLRLEQGRDQHPSEQVLDALAQALQLNDDAVAHLYSLARPTPRRGRARQRSDRVPTGVQQLLASWSHMPAYIHNRYMDVLAANPLATALSPFFAPGMNIVRIHFLEPAVRELLLDWEAMGANAVAQLRSIVSSDFESPRLIQLVGELSVRSERFRRLWARHDVCTLQGGTAALNHPQVGPLELRYDKFAVGAADGQVLVVYHAEPDSASARALAQLAHIAAARTQPDVPVRIGTSRKRVLS